jgi:hypothetical protein
MPSPKLQARAQPLGCHLAKSSFIQLNGHLTNVHTTDGTVILLLFPHITCKDFQENLIKHLG